MFSGACGYRRMRSKWRSHLEQPCRSRLFKSGFRICFQKRKVVKLMVELDQIKIDLQQYETPLAEVRDSL